MSATSEVDVTNSIARLDKLHDRTIRDLPAVSQVEIMEILSQLADSIHGQICQVSAFGKY
jgi:hypothetical protein